MSITYSAAQGTQINSHLVSQTIGTQTGGTNQIQVTSAGTAPSNATGYGGNVGDGTNGIGDTYVGRLIVLRKGTATEEIRICIAESGSAPTLLTLDQDWASAPASGDALDIPYEPGDIEDGGAGNGINLNTKTGLYELSNELFIRNTGGLQIANGNALELDDQGTTVAMTVDTGGWYYAGLEASDANISGGIMTAYNNAAGEPTAQFDGNIRVNDTLIWAQRVQQQFEILTGADDVVFSRVKWLGVTRELLLYSTTVNDCSVNGRSLTTDILRVDGTTSFNEMVLTNIEFLSTDTTTDGTPDTITLNDVLFSNVPGFIDVRNSKTWNMIDPVWTVTDNTDFTTASLTGAATVTDERSIKATIRNAAATAISSARVFLYEGTQTNSLVLDLTANASGQVDDSWIYKDYGWTGGTADGDITFGNHALRVDTWTYFPFVASQTTTEKISGSITITIDENIVQTNQSTALTAGSGITWNEETNPSTTVAFTSGSGTLTAGATVTGTGGATGVVTEFLDGDSASGTIHLKTRNATAFANGDSLTATGWSATYTNDSGNDFSVYIDGNGLSYQGIYDYLAAESSNTTLGTIGTNIHVWGKQNQARSLDVIGTNFFTERSGTLGVIVVNAGAGSVTFFTGDDGTTYVPPVQVSFSLTGLKDGTEIRIYRSSDSLALAGVEDMTGGVGTDTTTGVSVSGTTDDNDFTFQYTYGSGIYASPVPVFIVVVNFDFQILRLESITLGASDQSIPVSQVIDRNYIDPV